MLPRSFVTRALPVAAAAALLLGASACTDDDDPPDSTPTTTRPSTATSTTEAELSDEEQIEQHELEWFETTRRILGHDLPVTDANEFITGRYLEQYQGDFAAFEEAGYSARYSDESVGVIESVEVSDAEATAVVCTVDADIKIDATTGAIVDDATVAARFEDHLVDGPDGWRIEFREAIEAREEVTRCS